MTVSIKIKLGRYFIVMVVRTPDAAQRKKLNLLPLLRLAAKYRAEIIGNNNLFLPGRAPAAADAHILHVHHE
jgi:hypothetical protein